MKIIDLRKKHLGLLYPISFLKFLFSDREKFQNKILLRSAKKLFLKCFATYDWENALREISEKDFVPHKNINNGDFISGHSLNNTFGKLIYCIIRTQKPEIVVETGVAHGFSTWIILNALRKNKQGKLISIDLPDHDTNENYNLTNKKTGWIITNKLKDRWELNIGDSKEVLPEIFKKYPEIDIFFHDSDHSYENMKFEFNISFKYLKNPGFILSDDIHKNTAFIEFIKEHDLEAVIFNKGGMILID